MKLWQKNYLVTALLFTAVLFLCVAVLITLSVRMTLTHVRDGAISEEKAIAGALENMVLHNDSASIEPVVRGIARRYESSGVFLKLWQGGTVTVDLLPEGITAQEGALQWATEAGHVYVSIGEAFRGGFAMSFVKDVTEQAKTAVQSILLAVGICTLLSAGVNGALYYMMLRINKPLSRLSHELRTPLTVVRGYGELLQLAALSDVQRHNAASYIVEECDHMRDIIQKILTMNDRGHIERERIPLAPLKQHLLMAWPSITVETEGDAIVGDRTLLLSLLDNLIGNAEKAGGAVTVRLMPREIVVMDTGCGMDEPMLAYVNNPAKIERPESIKSGLGVPLCHEIARLHKGTLRFTSQIGAGTTATVRFYNSETTL